MYVSPPPVSVLRCVIHERASTPHGLRAWREGALWCVAPTGPITSLLSQWKTRRKWQTAGLVWSVTACACCVQGVGGQVDKGQERVQHYWSWDSVCRPVLCGGYQGMASVCGAAVASSTAAVCRSASLQKWRGPRERPTQPWRLKGRPLSRLASLWIRQHRTQRKS